MQRNRSVAELAYQNRLWLTTADVARLARVSTSLVRRWARQKELPFELAECGQRLFRRTDIRTALVARLEACARPRVAKLIAVRYQMAKVGEPRQLHLRLPTIVHGGRKVGSGCGTEGLGIVRRRA